MNVFIFSTRSCRNSGSHLWNIVTYSNIQTCKCLHSSCRVHLFLLRNAVHIARLMLWRGVYMSVCPDICHVRVFIVLYRTEWTNLRGFSPSSSPTILVFFRTKRFGEIPTGSSELLKGGIKCRWVWKNRDFDQYLVLSRKRYKIGP